MTIRIYWSPVTGTGVYPDGFRATAWDKPRNFIKQMVPSHGKYTLLGDVDADWGKPRHAHLFCIVGADDWTAFDADVNEILLLPDTGLTTRQQVLAAIKAATVADVPLAYRTRWLDVLAELAVSTADITGTTPLARVFRRVMANLDPYAANEEVLLD